MESAIGPLQTAAGCRDIRVVFRDRLWSGFTLKCRYSLPEVIEHGIGGRMPIMGSAVCLPTRDYVDARRLLLDDRCLHDPVLCISHVLPEQLPHRNKAVERLIPARDAVGADHRGRIFRVVRHRCPLITALQIMRTSLDITGRNLLLNEPRPREAGNGTSTRTTKFASAG